MTYEILIIDDDAQFRRILQRRLLGFFQEASFQMFDNLTDARAFLQSEKDKRFDLVILDQHLPDGQGIDFLQEGWFANMVVVSMSSDNAPEIPGAAVRAGANYFLSKTVVSEPLFRPLLEGIIDRNRLHKELEEARIQLAQIQTVKTLVATLKHEINNPLGAVLGAAYLLQSAPLDPSESKRIAELVEASGSRIKHVLDQLCDAIALEPVTKGNQKVFHIPGDKPWEGNK